MVEDLVSLQRVESHLGSGMDSGTTATDRQNPSMETPKRQPEGVYEQGSFRTEDRQRPPKTVSSNDRGMMSHRPEDIVLARDQGSAMTHRNISIQRFEPESICTDNANAETQREDRVNITGFLSGTAIEIGSEAVPNARCQTKDDDMWCSS